MKNFTLVLILLIPLMGFAQKPLPQILKKATTETDYGKNHISQPLKKMEELQKELSLNSIAEKIKQLQAEEKGLIISSRHNFPGKELIDKLRESRLKSAQTDTLLIDSLCIFTFRSPTDSVLTGKIFVTYNANGRRGLVWSYELDTLTMQWHYVEKNEYLYDENDRNTSYLEYLWDIQINDWLPVYKNEIEYDSNGRRTMFAYFNWDNNSEKWIGRTKYEYAWDEWGNQVLFAYYEWNYSTNNWRGNYKQQLAYDSSGNVTLIINSVWDEMHGDWIFQSKYESVFEQDGSKQMAIYWWDQNNKKWIGEYKMANYIISQTEQYSIIYSWNNLEDNWEESKKSVSKYLNDGLSHQFTTYIKQDSIIPGIVINGFNTEEDINTVWTDLSCPEQTCSVLDSDFVEGAASIRWDYHSSGKINYYGGACQFELLNSADMSGFDGISVNYKVLEPSVAKFVFVLIESDGEVWEYNNYELPRDTSNFWKVLVVPFNYIFPRNYVDGQLSLKNIEKILIQAFSEPGTENSGSMLLDNLSACNIAKSKLWMHESFTEEIFDENNNLITSTQSGWDPYLQEYIVFSKYKNEMVYDENGNIISKNSFSWNEGDQYIDTLSVNWNNISKEEFEYDEYGNQTRSEAYYWDQYFNGWIGGYKSEKTYDENGNILTSFDYQWQYEKKDWIPAYREENTFIADSIQTSQASYSYDSYLNKWIGNYKYETIFNEALEAIKEINYEWDYNAGTWKIINVSRVEHNEYQYDSEGRLQAYARETWNETLNHWCPKVKYYYFWSLHSITEAELVLLNQDGKLMVYPNPATDYICVKTASDLKNGTISLYNNNGQKVKTLQTVGDVTNINVNDLPAGNYMLQFATDKDVFVKKIIIW
ncbi:T9SS type A sorting domain-containing protein [Mariniphaga sp.]|uniref:T9SS type A sorting domain-containing protein n=1 Tax=Mariniphaga sp. TaxID=1954475 RepID=UPI003567532D